jgi:hypothetical protein
VPYSSGRGGISDEFSRSRFEQVLVGYLFKYPACLERCNFFMWSGCQSGDSRAYSKNQYHYKSHFRHAGVEINTASAKILGTMHVDTLEDKLLLLPYCSKPNHISVWSPGYYIHTFPCTGELIYNETLRPLEVGDNANYSWVGANFPSGFTTDLCKLSFRGTGTRRNQRVDAGWSFARIRGSIFSDDLHRD